MDKKQLAIYVAYILIIITAIALRFWRLTEIAYTVWLDEAWFGASAAKIVSGETWIPLQRADELGIGDSAFQIYSAAAMQLLGVSQTFSSRFASAVWGSLAVVLTYPVLVNILPKETERHQQIGLVATFVMATLMTGLIHSRHGLQMASSAAMSLVFLYSFTRLHRDGAWRWVILTGFVMGIGMATYEAFLAVPIYFVAYTALRLIWPSTLERRPLLIAAGCTVLVALITWSPLIVFYINNPGIYFSHGIKTVGFSVGESIPLWDRLFNLAQTALTGFGRVWGGISFIGDSLPGRNLPGQPLFLPFISLLFWIGLLGTVWKKWRDPAFQMLLVWALVFTLPSALSNQSPAFSRMLPMTPILAGFVGLGFSFAKGWLDRAIPNKTVVQGATTAVISAIVLSGAWSANIYFNQWSTDPRLFDTFRMGDRVALEHALNLEAEGNNVFLVPESNPFLKYPSQTMRADRHSKMVVFDADPACLPLPYQQPNPTVFGTIDIEGDSLHLALEEIYATAERLEQYTVLHQTFGSVHARFLQIPAGQTPPPPQVQTNAQFAEGIQLTGYDLETVDGGLALTFHWAGTQAVAPAVSYFVHVGQGDNSDPFIGNVSGELCSSFLPWRWTAGYRYIETIFVPLPDPLPEGNFDIRVGLYDTITGARLPIESTDLYNENNRLRLQELP